MVKIGTDVYVQAQEFKGKHYVSIRQWYEEEGELRPGRKGINLKIEEWNEMIAKLGDIQDEIKKATS